MNIEEAIATSVITGKACSAHWSAEMDHLRKVAIEIGDVHTLDIIDSGFMSPRQVVVSAQLEHTETGFFQNGGVTFNIWGSTEDGPYRVEFRLDR